MAPLLNIFCLWICIALFITNAGAQVPKAEATLASVDPPRNSSSKSVKKDLKEPSLEAEPPVIVISEKTLSEIQAEKEKQQTQNDHHAAEEAAKNTEKKKTSSGPMTVEETKFMLKQPHIDDDIPDSLRTGAFLFLGLSCAAVLFIVVKIYRMRLSRAERKYGVQGDRSTQELTPLPISIEDANSDDEDQTLFDISRQQIRIL